MTMRLRRALPAVLLAVLAAGTATAQAVPPQATAPLFGMALGIGVANYPDGTWQSLSLTPDIALGEFGLGLDVKLNYNFQGPGGSLQVRAADWVPTSLPSFLEIYLPKIRYVRWGEKGDPLYVKFGSIDDGTLGNGFVMAGYANTLFLPADRHFGLSFDLDGQLFGFPLVGFESFVGDLARLDVFGGRLYVRPLLITRLPILEMLELGGSFAMDNEPYRYSTGVYAPPSPVAVVDVDLRLPILTGSVFSLAAFGDVATILNNGGWGGMVGVGGRLIGFLTYGVQLRILGDGFIPVYFDATYDQNRAEWYDNLLTPADLPGSVGWFSSIGTSLFDDKIVLNIGLAGPFGFGPDTTVAAQWPALRGTFTIADGILPGLSFDASYDKKKITSPASLIDPVDAAIQAKLNYRTGPAVISFVYKLTRIPGAVPPAQLWDVTSGLESSIVLF